MEITGISFPEKLAHPNLEQKIGMPPTGEGSPAKRAKRDDGFMLGGHDGGVRPEGSSAGAAHVLKKKQPGTRGEREEQFLRRALAHPFLSRCVVRYCETREEGGHAWLVLEVGCACVPSPRRAALGARARRRADARAPRLLRQNAFAGMKRPAALDLKMGTRTYGDDATPAKVCVVPE